MFPDDNQLASSWYYDPDSDSDKDYFFAFHLFATDREDAMNLLTREMVKYLILYPMQAVTWPR